MFSNNIDDYRIDDPHPGQALDAIFPLSARAISLMARNRTKPLLKGGYINVTGAIEMLEGMEYHHDNFVRICTQLGNSKAALTDTSTSLNHEAVAYLGRLGQFYSFAKSKFVRCAIPNVDLVMPTIMKFMVFRKKHVAHRSLDNPWPADTDILQISHATSLLSKTGRLFMPRPNMPVLSLSEVTTIEELGEFLRQQWSHSYLAFQLFDADSGSHVNFSVESEHPAIVVEAYGILERVILHDTLSDVAENPPDRSLAG